MNAREIRDELLAQHAALRTQIARTRTDIEAWSRGELAALEMRTEVEALSSAMRAHNLREEQLLGETIRTIDTCDHERAGIMDERHRDEHAELDTALTLNTTAPGLYGGSDWVFGSKGIGVAVG